MAKFIKRGNSLQKEVKKKIRRDDKIFLTNITVLILSVVLSFMVGNIIPFIGWLVFRKIIDKKWKRAMRDVDIARAGLVGEKLTENVLDTLPDTYKIFSDFKIVFEGKESQIDHAVIGPKGVFVVETKYWSGDIIQGEDDNHVNQVGRHGGMQEHYHPSKQVATHVYRISSVLKENGIDAWVKGCVYFSHEDVKVFVEDENYPLFDRAGGLLTYLKSDTGNNLSEDKIDEIIKILKKRAI